MDSQATYKELQISKRWTSKPPIRSFKLSACKTIFFREISKNLEACARGKKMKNEQNTS